MLNVQWFHLWSTKYCTKSRKYYREGEGSRSRSTLIPPNRSDVFTPNQVLTSLAVRNIWEVPIWQKQTALCRFPDVAYLYTLTLYLAFLSYALAFDLNSLWVTKHDSLPLTYKKHRPTQCSSVNKPSIYNIVGSFSRPSWEHTVYDIDKHYMESLCILAAHLTAGGLQRLKFFYSFICVSKVMPLKNKVFHAAQVGFRWRGHLCCKQ